METKTDHKHVAAPPPATVVHRLLVRILEVSTMELVVGIIHCVLTALAVFGLVHTGGGGH